MNEQNTALMERTPFLLPDLVSSAEFSQDELAEDMEGMNFDFQRVKVPSGGALQFELPTDNPDNPQYVKCLEGVIVYQHNSNAYWSGGHDDEEKNMAPQCQSLDGKLGIGQPGGLCAGCPYNQFGSGANGKGKSCKNMRILYLLRSGESMPIQLTLPPTSLRPFTKFSNMAFMLRRRAAWGSLVRIGLKRANNGKDDYSVATFTKVRDFSGEELAGIRDYVKGFNEQIKQILSQRAGALEAESADIVEVSAPIRVMPENDGHFAVGSAAAGDSPDDML